MTTGFWCCIFVSESSRVWPIWKAIAYHPSDPKLICFWPESGIWLVQNWYTFDLKFIYIWPKNSIYLTRIWYSAGLKTTFFWPDSDILWSETYIFLVRKQYTVVQNWYKIDPNLISRGLKPTSFWPEIDIRVTRNQYIFDLFSIFINL